MPVGKVEPVMVVGSGAVLRERPAAAAGAPSAHRALVRVVPVDPTVEISGRPADTRAATSFLAHLIATVQGAPQTRERRRTDPNWATAVYSAAMQIPTATGQAVRETR